MEVEEGDYDGEEDDGLEAEEEEEEEEEGEEEEVSLLILCRYGLQWDFSNNGHQRVEESVHLVRCPHFRSVMHARVVLGVGKGVLFKEVSGIPYGWGSTVCFVGLPLQDEIVELSDDEEDEEEV